MKIVETVLVVLLLAGACAGARASIITFDLTGVPGISGYVQYDSSYFHGFAFDYVPNTAIVGLDIDVFGAHFDLGNLVDIPGFSAAIMDTITPRIINGYGLLADNGVNAIAFWPDGSDGTPMDGDAALSFQTSVWFLPETTYAVHWTVAAIPEPGTVALLGAVALIGVASRRPQG